MKIAATRKVGVKSTPRLLQIEGQFGLEHQVEESRTFEAELPIEQDWDIGVIVGPSGSGKTTLGRELARRLDGLFVSPRNETGEPVEPFDWPADKCVVDGFPAVASVLDVTEALSSMGFASVPAWRRPFAALSNGEQFRATMARAIVEAKDRVLVVDEFTSVVDRTVARIGSAATSKLVRRRKQKLIAVTCHYDVLDWLEADWVLDLASGKLARGRLRRPEIHLRVHRWTSEAWHTFAPHHYLTAELQANGAICFLATWNARPVAFVAVLHLRHPTATGYRESRCVVLPDFQGVGIGNRVSNFVASAFAGAGHNYYSRTGHPAMTASRRRSGLWVDSGPQFQSRQSDRESRAWNRKTASFRWIGPADIEAAKAMGLKS